MTEAKPDIATLVADVVESTRTYRDAQQATSFARNAECDALNRLNAAQRALDAALADIRLGAPRESDWKSAPSQPGDGER